MLHVDMEHCNVLVSEQWGHTRIAGFEACKKAEPAAGVRLMVRFFRRTALVDRQVPDALAHSRIGICVATLAHTSTGRSALLSSRLDFSGGILYLLRRGS